MLLELAQLSHFCGYFGGPGIPGHQLHNAAGDGGWQGSQQRGAFSAGSAL